MGQLFDELFDEFPRLCRLESAKRRWREAGWNAASLAEDQGQHLEPGREPTTDELTEGATDELSLDERRREWRLGWDGYVTL